MNKLNNLISTSILFSLPYSKHVTESIMINFVVFNAEMNNLVPHLACRTVNICSLNLEVFSHYKFLNLIESLNVNKSAATDKIHPKVMRYCAESFAKILRPIFENSFKTGKVPTKWKEANITPIFKKGGRCEASKYRPISLTALPCKIITKIVHDFMLNHLM